MFWAGTKGKRKKVPRNCEIPQRTTTTSIGNSAVDTYMTNYQYIWGEYEEMTFKPSLETEDFGEEGKPVLADYHAKHGKQA